MNENAPEKEIDISGVELSPGKPTVCLGNGDQGFECCCDECNYFLLCFPKYEQLIEENIKDIEIPPPSKRHKIRINRLFREFVGGTYLPFPEVDCSYERVRSKIIVKLNFHKIFNLRKRYERSK